MTNPEIEYRRLASCDVAAITRAAEDLHEAVFEVDRAQADLAGCVVGDWSGWASEAYAARLGSLRASVAQTHVALIRTQNALATAGQACSTCEETATYFIGFWRSRPAGLPAVVEELYARLINGLLLATGTTYNDRLAGVSAMLTGGEEDLAELSDEAREWVEEGLSKNDEWLDDYGSTLGPRIPSIGAWGDGRGLIPQGLGYDPASGLLLQGYYDFDAGESSVMALIDEVTGREVGEVKLGGMPSARDEESVLTESPGHSGGVTVEGDHVYVTDKGRVYTYSLADMRAAGRGATVQPKTAQIVRAGGAYSAMRDGLLYLGRFTEDGDGSLHVYEPDVDGGWDERPDLMVVTPPRCQGVILREDGYVFSTSFKRGNESSLVVQGLDGSRESFVFPNMAEGLVEVNGNVLVTYESGATEYSTGSDALWANPTMTSTPLAGLGLSSEMVVGFDSLKLVAAELEAPSRQLSRAGHDTARIHVSASDFGRVPQAPCFARTVRQLITGIADGLRANGRAAGHAADSLRATQRDAIRTDDAISGGFNRARLD